MPKSKKRPQKPRRRQRARRHTIHILDGRPLDIPDVPGLDKETLPFMGQLMVCIMCGKTERSDPRVQSQWRCIVAGGVPYYVCPAEFPPDGAGREAFKAAYERVLERIVTLQK